MPRKKDHVLILFFTLSEIVKEIIAKAINMKVSSERAIKIETHREHSI